MGRRLHHADLDQETITSFSAHFSADIILHVLGPMF